MWVIWITMGQRVGQTMTGSLLNDIPTTEKISQTPSLSLWWCYMGGGLLQQVGFFKKPNQLGPKSTGQYCTSSKAPATGQPGRPMTLTASHPARTMPSCTPPSSMAAATPVGLSLPAPHPSTLIRQQCGRYLQKQMQHVLKAMPSRHMSSQAGHS